MNTRELPTNESWELLRTRSVARLAVVLDGQPDIFPVNYVADRGTLIFRTAEGTKFFAAVEGPVAVEIDGTLSEGTEAFSVVLKGAAHQIVDVDELIETFDLPVHPWQAGDKGIFVRVRPTLVTGRRFPVAGADAWPTP